MKFLILALCVCAASAASFDYKPYKPYQPPQQFQGFRKPVSAPVVSSAYSAAKYAAPVAKPVYNVPKPVEIVAEPVYNAAEVVAAAPMVAAKAVYDTARVAAVAPVVAAKTIYNNGKEAEADILRSSSDVSADGFNYAYETSNGIAAQSSGTLKNVEGTPVLVSQGSYQYIASDGTPVKFEYVADENGYQPRSDLLPVGPPVPVQILRALEYIRAHPPKPENY